MNIFHDGFYSLKMIEITLKPHTNHSDRTLDQEQFERLKSLEQELSNQKLLSKFTKLRLEKKESECIELQKSEKAARIKIRELMGDIASISKKNSDLMSYCESKVAQCRSEYDKMTKNTFQLNQNKKRMEEEVAGLRKKCSENTLYRNECTKLRATISTLRSQLKDSTAAIDVVKRENKGLKAQIETQKQRLNESSKNISKINGDLATYKLENRRLKSNVASYKEKISDLEVDQEELTAENRDIKEQIQRFSKQLEHQSMIQSEIIGLQQTLNKESKRSIPSPSKSIRSITSPTKSIRSFGSIPSPTKSLKSMRSISPMKSLRSHLVTTAFSIDTSQVDNAEEEKIGNGRTGLMDGISGKMHSKTNTEKHDCYESKREQ